MDVVSKEKKSSSLTDPQPENQVQAAFKGNTCDDYAAPLFIPWQLNSACNLGCLHCCEEAGRSMPDEMTKNEALDFCKQVVELDIPYMAISGGEPLTCPHLFDVCRFIRDNNISLKIETNGELIDDEFARRLAELKLRSVQVSLDGATPETHEKLRVGGDWKKAVAACKYLVQHGVNTEIVFVPTKFNIHEISDVIDLAYSMGVYGIYTGKIMQIGRAAKNWDILCPSDEEYEEFSKVLREKKAAYEGKLLVYCYAHDVIEELKYRIESPSASVLVLPNGKVKLINSLPFICGDLKKESLSQVWENYKKAWRNPEVVEFIKKVIDDPKLLAESNNWREV